MLLEQEVKPLIERFMHNRGLTLSLEKTKTTHIDEGFDFLGCNIRKHKGKLIIKPAKKNIAAFLKKIRSIIKKYKTVKQYALIKMLNPMIRGWANYHQHTIAKKIYARVDHEITRALWLWAKRRHPKKSSTWVYQRYFHSIGMRRWVFAAPTGDFTADGKPILTLLWNTTQTPITRHVPIRMSANPFDPEWELYFEERAGKKMKISLHTRKKLLKL